MKVAILQYPIEWADVDTNLNLTERRLSQIQGKADLALLPEMFTTGFCTDRPELAEPMDGPTVSRLREWAHRFDMAIAGSFMAADKQNLYNRGFFIRPDGDCDFVDKRHLYAHGGEASFFTPGQKRVISEYKGVRFCLLICYDLRFPVWSRNGSGFDYDVLLYTANWPEIRIKAWDTLLPARVIENQCIVCACNRVGDDALGLHYPGHSMVLDSHLNNLVTLSNDEAGTAIVELPVDKIRHYRQTLPLWKDADKFALDIQAES